MHELSERELDWITTEELIEIAHKRFAKSARRVAEASPGDLRVEPTLAIVRAGLTGDPLENSETTDLAVSTTKTIQNAVGLFHQDVLGSVKDWESTGTSGGVIDLKGVSPVTGDEIVAELKMRYNTIKASDEKVLWDGIKAAAQVSGSGVKGYLFQVVPRTNNPYDKPWKVSGRNEIDFVRCADGVTAYHLVTGSPTALFDLMNAMPYVMAEVASLTFGNRTEAVKSFASPPEVLASVISQSLPATSYHSL